MNLFEKIPADLSREVIETLICEDGINIERIVSHGQASPPGFWYDQDTREWVIVLRGRAKLRFDNEKDLRTLSPGDFADIPAHRKHRVEWTDPHTETIWLAIHWQGKYRS